MSMIKSHKNRAQGIGVLARKTVIAFAAGFFISVAAYGSPGINAVDNHKDTSLKFIENKGQMDSRAKYMAYLNGGVVYLNNGGFVYDYYDQQRFAAIAEKWHDGESVENEKLSHHSFKVNFVGANTNIQYAPSSKRKYYYNYITGSDSSSWFGKVGIFDEVNMNNVYDGIDMAVYGKGTDLKYDFRISPGADPSLIRFSYEGVTPALTAEGHLRIKTSVNEIQELAPFTYQVIDGRQKEIASKYYLKDNQLSFQILEEYDKSLPLIIDPQLKYATYSGAIGAPFLCMSTTYDATGCLYVPGNGVYSNAPGGWPATVGAYQTAVTGGAGLQYGVINKYSSDGSTLVYSTYIGISGTLKMLINSMATTTQNELVITGSVSGAGYPVTAGAYDQTLGGTTDIFVTKFKADGSGLLQSTYVGGSLGGPTGSIGIEAGVASELVTTNNQPTGPISYFPQSNGYGNSYLNPVDLQIDNTGRIWIASSTNATNFPVTANAIHPTFRGGLSDGVVFCLDATLSNLVYSTYFGGNGVDVLEGIAIMPNGNIAVSGFTTSTNMPASAGALHVTLTGGVSDGIIGIINPATGALTASTYLGTTGQDNACKIQADVNNDIYILGRTNGNYPISAGAYNLANGMLFIQKLNSTLTTSLGSTRTGFPVIATPNGCNPSAFLVDSCGTIYLGCIGLVTSVPTPLPVMPVTPDAFVSTARNFWCATMSNDLTQLKFATYFGSAGTANNADHQHQGNHHFDPRGILYQSICARLDNNLGTAGSWSQHMQNATVNSVQDPFSFKIDFQLFVHSDFSVDPTSNNGRDTGCAPLELSFSNNSTDSVTYIWDFGDGSPISNAASPTHIFQAGEYDVKLIAIDNTPSLLCHKSDTAIIHVVAIQRTKPFISLNDTVLCNYDPVSITATVNNTTPQTTYQWSPAAAIVSGNGSSSVIVNPAVNQNITLKAFNGTGECDSASETSMHITIADIVNARVIPADTSICPGDTILLKAFGGNNYLWSPIYNISSTDTQAVSVWPLEDINYLIAITDTNNCKAEIRAHINVRGNLDVDAGNDIDIKYGESALLDGKAPGSFFWQYNVYPDNVLRPEVSPQQTTTYYLTGKSGQGCVVTDSVTVYVTFAQMPNAFSPNGDDLNDVFKLMPDNTHFKLLNFSIYDRWGNRVFYTEDVNEGWDGTYKNKAADMGVYYYYVAYAIGAKNYTLKGDVSLIR